MSISIKKFQQTIWSYYKKHKRSMPWRETRDPYKVLISEVMLQQTQVERVIPKYNIFIKKFPTGEKLAKAPLFEVLKVWLGLGYNRRALVSKYGGQIPADPELLDELPGIGEATAGAICVYAFNQKVIFVETNVRTVFIHFFFSKTKRKISDEEIAKLVGETLPKKVRPFSRSKVEPFSVREWFYALMDYGAMLKRARTYAERTQTNADHKGFVRNERGIFSV